MGLDHYESSGRHLSPTRHVQLRSLCVYFFHPPSPIETARPLCYYFHPPTIILNPQISNPST